MNCSTPQEIARAQQWFEQNLLSAKPIFSFLYGGKPSGNLEGWQRSSESQSANSQTRYTLAYSDPGTGLTVRCEAVAYQDYPAVEWTVYLKNTGTANTPLIENLWALDSEFFPYDRHNPIWNQPDVVLHHFKGDYCTEDGYEPQRWNFYGYGADDELVLHPYGGRGTNRAFPYYRLQGPDDGMLMAVGWPGQWETRFCSLENTVRVRAGQQAVHFTLLPGEEIRTPLMALVFYDGQDSVRAQNLWRQWFLDYVQLKPDGKQMEPIYCNYGGRIFFEMEEADEEKMLGYLRRFTDNKIPFDYLWMDAGWYPIVMDHWPNTGTWETDKTRFPNGFRPICDEAHRHGIKTIVWFEPERVTKGTWIYENHPEWCLSWEPQEKTALLHPTESVQTSRVLNLGNPAAQAWLTEHILTFMKTEGIDLYREDFNTEPLAFWQANDAPDRQGITENHYVTGHLAYWDALQAGIPGLVIDSCASGGRRNDLETLRRALPFHKTDYDYTDMNAKQAFHHSLFQWLPYFSAMNLPADQDDIYYHRSAYGLCYLGADNVTLPSYDFPKLKTWMEEWRTVAPLFYGDYYPLTPYSRDDRTWIGWQFHHAERREGIVQMFMHKDAPYTAGNIRLLGLDPGKTYEMKDWDIPGQTFQMTGHALTTEGLPLTAKKCPDCALVQYREI